MLAANVQRMQSLSCTSAHMPSSTKKWWGMLVGFPEELRTPLCRVQGCMGVKVVCFPRWGPHCNWSRYWQYFPLECHVKHESQKLFCHSMANLSGYWGEVTTYGQATLGVECVSNYIAETSSTLSRPCIISHKQELSLFAWSMISLMGYMMHKFQIQTSIFQKCPQIRQSSLMSSLSDVIILTGVDVGVKHLEPSKTCLSFLLGFCKLCCGVKNTSVTNLAIQDGKGNLGQVLVDGRTITTVKQGIVPSDFCNKPCLGTSHH